MLVAEADLALIDSVAETNRAAFMVNAAIGAALRIRRSREDEEIARICSESATRDLALARGILRLRRRRPQASGS